ncbi:type 2 lanthipeptide synthetase LanM [Chryseobacterium lactis]|uniref:type 2 lanthipeptide synthetase LanM n=1 Tax=Chryseobacterium lactis TaxID=1241981 RepID=UPI0016277C25|nr:type 2 lanthipeptide synthetase LanM [Chryseobacterium lactis]
MVPQSLYTNIQDPALLFIEGVLLACFEDFKNLNAEPTFENYKRELESSNLYSVFNKYPVAKKLLNKYEQKKTNLVSFITEEFTQNIESLHQKGILCKKFSAIENIEIGVGDFHKGLSTAILHFENNEKAVFKPTKVDITQSFFKLLDWANQYYSLGDYHYQVLGSNNYHWLEFVKHTPCQTEEQLHVYYERAGFMLGVLYILNAVDFHYENIIARKGTPVIIDHETIIQPKIHPKNQQFFKKNIVDEIEDSVLLTMLLPNQKSTSLPVGTCGYGYHKQTRAQNLTNESTDRYTDNWRFITRFVDESFQKQNIPTLNGRAVYPVEYIEELLRGFETCYQLFLDHRCFLLEDEGSPLQDFNSKSVRYIWRDTNIYTKINNQMKLPKNLISTQHYEQKIHDYLFAAFKNVPVDSDLLLIHKHETAQMIKGDIPFFEVNSSSTDLQTNFGVIKDFFEYSAVDNLGRKLKKLSFQDLEFQKKLIKESLLN